MGVSMRKTAPGGMECGRVAVVKATGEPVHGVVLFALACQTRAPASKRARGER